MRNAGRPCLFTIISILFITPLSAADDSAGLLMVVRLYVDGKGDELEHLREGSKRSWAKDGNKGRMIFAWRQSFKSALATHKIHA